MRSDAAWEKRPLCEPLYSQLAVFSTSMSQVALAGEMSHRVMRCPKCFSLICDLRTIYFTSTAVFPVSVDDFCCCLLLWRQFFVSTIRVYQMRFLRIVSGYSRVSDLTGIFHRRTLFIKFLCIFFFNVNFCKKARWNCNCFNNFDVRKVICALQPSNL